MNLKQLRQRASDLKNEILKVKRDRVALGESALKETRNMTEEERAQFLALGQRVEQLESQLTETEELLAIAEEANEQERAWRGEPQPTDDQVTVAAPTPRIQVVDPATRPGYFGAQLQAIRKLALQAKGMGNEPVTAADLELVKPMKAAATGLNTDVPSEGGFVVQTQQTSGILQRAYEIGPILSRVNRMPIGAGFNGVTMPAIDETSRADSSRYGGIVSTWVGQGTAVTSGKPKFRLIELKLRKVMATVYATDEQIADAVALESWINRYLPLELTFRTEDSIFNGTGSNQPLGVLNSGAVLSVTRATASHVKYEDVRGMWARMWAPLRPTAAWFIDQSVEPDLEQLSIAIGTAGVLAPIYRPAGSLPGQTYATLYGRPVIPVEYCANLGTSGDIVLVNLDEYVLIDKGGVDQAVSLHVAFLTDEAVYRFIYRVDGQLTWNAALQPKSGGSTLSCALVLS